MNLQSKFCVNCKSAKSKLLFGKNRRNKDGLSRLCKPCNYIQIKIWRKANPDLYRSQKLRNRYGIEQKDYIKLFDSQNGKCAICALPQAEQTKPLEVDHDHSTNRIRGLLCQNCNKVLGLMGDNIHLFYKAANYLEGLRV